MSALEAAVVTTSSRLDVLTQKLEEYASNQAGLIAKLEAAVLGQAASTEARLQTGEGQVQERLTA